MSAPDINGLLMAHPYGAVILIVLFLVVMAFLNLRWREKASTRRHRRYRATAGRVLNKLNSLPGDGQRLTYLRKISPYVFEELLLSAFERQGLSVVRNASYSGDGGLDGQVIIDGEHWLIQAKRYSRAVSPHMLRTSTGFSCSPAAGGCLSTRAVPEK
jgi:restriction system protein